MKKHSVSKKNRDNRKNAQTKREEEFHREENICSTCGFDKNLSRGYVILDKNILSYKKAEENTCAECGHQKDGSTIGKSIAIKNGR
ncbi:MAG: hypothetical protein ACTSPB_00395 [Candidatus Thorarchaeota archaeon]